MAGEKRTLRKGMIGRDHQLDGPIAVRGLAPGAPMSASVTVSVSAGHGIPLGGGLLHQSTHQGGIVHQGSALGRRHATETRVLGSLEIIYLLQDSALRQQKETWKKSLEDMGVYLMFASYVTEGLEILEVLGFYLLKGMRRQMMQSGGLTKQSGMGE